MWFRQAKVLLGTLMLAFTLHTPAPAQQTYLPGLLEFEPTPFHETIYEMVEECTGESGDFEALRWYMAASLFKLDGTEYWGLWFDSWGYPAIVLDRQKVYDGETVSHEIMHDLYKGQGPMDMYRLCVLDWENLTPIIQTDTETEEDPDG